jgi:hypothetical protein
VLAGVLQLLFGILRAGRFISLVPASVIKGMLAAIQQAARGDGHRSDGESGIALNHIGKPGLFRRAERDRVKSLRWIPGPLIAVLLGCVTTLLLTHFAPQQLAATTHTDGLRHALHAGDSSSPSRSPRLPNAGRVILLSQEALKKLRPQNPPPSPNREMVAQGVGNLLSGSSTPWIKIDSLLCAPLLTFTELRTMTAVIGIAPSTARRR